MKQGYVYILGNETNDVLYIGVTSDLQRRLYEHRNHLVKGFTDKYNVTRVLYVESTSKMYDAIVMEKRIKGWLREKKIELIKKDNPNLHDLYDEIMGE